MDMQLNPFHLHTCWYWDKAVCGNHYEPPVPPPLDADSHHHLWVADAGPSGELLYRCAGCTQVEREH